MQLNSIFESFLSDDSSFKGFWIKNPGIKVNKIDGQLQGTFYKTGKTIKWSVKRAYFMFDDYLYYAKNNSKNTNVSGKAYLPSTVFIAREQVGKNFYVYLKRGMHIVKFYSKNEQEYIKWVKALESKCILLNFHLDFEMMMVLGKGAFAEVYSTRHKTTKHIYATKCFSKRGVAKERKGKEGLMCEIEVMQRMRHPRLVNLHFMYEDEEYVYLVMDYMKGGELLKRIDFLDEFSEYEVRLLMKNLFETVWYIHSKEIIHRDIKLDNILLKSEESISDVAIADFGLATFMNNKDKAVYKRCGTPGFVAPEIINYKEGKSFYDEKADLFSCGIVMHILLTGSKVFSSNKVKEVLALNKECTINWDSDIYDGLSDDAVLMLKELLHKDPLSRLSAEEALEHPFIKDMDKKTHRVNLKKNLPYIELNRLSFLLFHFRVTKSYDQNSGGYSPLVIKNLGARSRRYSNQSNNSNQSKRSRSRQNSPHDRNQNTISPLD